jgi:hypothetical protein
MQFDVEHASCACLQGQVAHDTFNALIPAVDIYGLFCFLARYNITLMPEI